jgi:hypothetical protein
MSRAVARARPGEKGGRDAAATIDTKTTGHRSQRRGFVAEPFRNQVEWFTGHKDRAEGLVLALEGLLGLEEELAGVALVPARAPGC